MIAERGAETEATGQATLVRQGPCGASMSLLLWTLMGAGFHSRFR